MSGEDDAEEVHRYKPAYNQHHSIPTIKKFREEKEARKAEAIDRDGGKDDSDLTKSWNQRLGEREGKSDDQPEADKKKDQDNQQSAGAEVNGEGQHEDDKDLGPAEDITETGSAATDAKGRRKELKHRKDERAERKVTDPVTHLPVTIHDLTSDALEEIPENDDTFGTTSRTATGVENQKKSGEQLRDEQSQIQRGHESLRALFPPPNFDEVKNDLVDINKFGITVGLAGVAVIVLAVVAFERLVVVEKLTYLLSKDQKARWCLGIFIWVLIAGLTVGAVVSLIVAVRNWVAKRIDSAWDDEVWDASDHSIRQQSAKAHETETVAWLNALLSSIWPLINPDLFISLADTLEDVMQASLPRLVQMVSVNDIGQGSESIRILGIRWLPTGAAARSVTEDGKLKDPSSKKSNDRSVPGEGEVEQTDNDQHKSGNDQKDSDDKAQQGDDGAQQQISEGLEAEEGDFVNVEIAFAYRAKANKRSIRDRANDMHLYIAFYLPGNVKIPVWVDLRGMVGTMRMRLQLCPDPPFFSLCTLTFLGQPKVDIRCTPLSRHAVNIMDVPLISNFVQSAVDAAMAEYVAPKSLTLDLQDMLAGDDFKKDTDARGILVVNIKRGYDFKTGDAGIPLIKDGSSDPYVSVGWAKFGKVLWSTRLLTSEMHPYWDETTYVLVSPAELNVDERVRIQLWDSDRLTADDDLGRIEVELKELMKRSESNGSMWHRTDGFRALKAGDSMPGKLEWCVGYYPKAKIQGDQFKKQSFDPKIRDMDQLKEKVDSISERKLREAKTKEGRHKRDADELDQQNEQELKRMQDAMIISAPPPEGFPSGIFSIQIHQITGLELEKLSKSTADNGEEAADEAEEGEGLPSSYATILINDSKVFKTRTKPKNAKPFFNAGTERFIPDWKNTEVYVVVRDARVKEDDALLGIVHLPLGEVFKERAQINGFYPLTGGVGHGRIRLSLVWRSVSLQAPPEALGWEYGTVEVKPSVAAKDLPEDLKAYKLKFHTDLGSAKMYPDKQNGGWNSRKQKSLKLPVRKRYSTCLAVQFRNHGMFGDKTAAFATFWLKNIQDQTEEEITIPVWKGDFDRAVHNALPEPGEKVGSITLKLTFWEGLGSAHSKWASKNDNLREVVEVLDVARDNYEMMQSEKEAGVVHSYGNDSNDDDSSDEEGGEGGKEKDGEDGHRHGLIDKAKDFKKHNEELGRHNRGLMQWRIPRTAKYALHKVERTESKITDLFKHHTRSAGVETEV